MYGYTVGSAACSKIYIYLSRKSVMWVTIAPPAVAECIYIIPKIMFIDIVYGITHNQSKCVRAHHSLG